MQTLVLDSDGSLQISDGTVTKPGLTFLSDTNTGFYRIGSDNFGVAIGGSLAWAWDPNGRLLNGTSSSISVGSNGFQLQIHGAGATGLGVVRYSANSSGPIAGFGKSRATSVGGTAAAVTASDNLGAFNWYADDGTNLATQAVGFQAVVDGAVSTGVVPGRMEIYTSTSAGVSTRAFLVNSSQQALVQNGTAALPTLGFINDSTTGLYRIGASNMGLTLGGALAVDVSATRANFAPTVQAAATIGITVTSAQPRMKWNETDQGLDLKNWEFLGSGSSWFIRTMHDNDSAGENAYYITRGATTATGVDTHVWRTQNTDRMILNASGQMTFSNGTALLPSWSFISDATTGMYRVGASNLGITLGGTLRYNFTASQLRLATSGSSVSAPDLAGDGDTNTGLWWEAADQLAVVCGGSASGRFTNNAFYSKLDPAVVSGITGFVDSNTAVYSGGAYLLTRAAAIPFAYFARVNTSYAAPSGILSGNDLGEVAFGGYDTAQMRLQTVRITASAASDWSTTNQGTTLTVQVTTDGTTSRSSVLAMGSNSTGAYARLPSGAASQPGIAFVSDTSTGLYRISASNVGLALGGNLRYNFTASQFLLATSGATVSAPDLAGNGDSNTGLFWSAADSLQLVCGGTSSLSLTTTAVTSALSITSSGAAAGIGYSSGAGGTVAQTTSRTTGVTLNKVSGAITLVSAAGSTTFTSFTVTNSTVAATDVVRVVQKSGTDKYQIHVTAVGSGSFEITFSTTGGTTTEQPVFNFAVIKAVAA